VDDFRPEYVQALDAARWNFWWFVAVAIPPLVLIQAAVKRHSGCMAFSLSFGLSWIALFCSVQYYWGAKIAVAKTVAEISDATNDAGASFGPFYVGIPLVFVYVLFVGVFVYGGTAIFRRLRRPRQT